MTNILLVIAIVLFLVCLGALWYVLKVVADIMEEIENMQ